MLGKELTGDSGASTRTLHASLVYIKAFEPPLVLLENVHKKVCTTVATRLLQELPPSALRAIRALFEGHFLIQLR